MRRLLLFVFSHRFLAIARWELHFIGLRARNSLFGGHASIRRALSRKQRPLFLNLGAGPRGLCDPHWLNIDGFKAHNVEFLLDISRPIAFPDAAFDGVFCEHVLEHFSLEDGEKIAAEVCRMLQPCGVFRVIVPDAEKVVRRYIETPEQLRAWSGNCRTAMEAVNSAFRQRYEHQFLYDWPTIELMLRRAGFESINRTTFRSGSVSALVLDDEKYEWESLYVDAKKASTILEEE